MTNVITDPCVLCGESIAENANSPIWLKGNNALPLAEGQCCDICNDAVVLARITEVMSNEK
mgnify:CR=1 FL=1